VHTYVFVTRQGLQAVEAGASGGEIEDFDAEAGRAADAHER
jgi:hypothetical protein